MSGLLRKAARRCSAVPTAEAIVRWPKDSRHFSRSAGQADSATRLGASTSSFLASPNSFNSANAATVLLVLPIPGLANTLHRGLSKMKLRIWCWYGLGTNFVTGITTLHRQ